LVLAAAFLAGISLAAVFAVETFKNPERMLTIESGNVQADAAVVLGGDSIDRSLRAAEIYHQGQVPRILVSGTGDTDRNILALEKEGVPRSAIIKEPDSRSTFQNAAFSSTIFHRMGIKKIIIVTSWYHSRRALACFRQAAPDLTFYSCPSYVGYAPRSAGHRTAGTRALMEYPKMFFYWVRYGVSPLR
jgi:uncharacterized SAM-binding protein YcdF (DUF218 family)